MDESRKFGPMNKRRGGIYEGSKQKIRLKAEGLVRASPYERVDCFTVIYG